MVTIPDPVPMAGHSRPQPRPGPRSQSYEYFDNLVGRLKRSAIDAYMCGDGGWRLVGNHYESSVNGSLRTSRPDGNGEGGGVPLMGGEEHDPGGVAKENEAEFNKIRSDIDKIVEKWRGLPDPEEIHKEVERWQAVFAAFDISAYDGGDDPLVRNVGRLHDDVNGDVHHGTSESLRGESATAFKEYVDSLYTAVATCRNIALVTGAAVAAQEGLWRAARDDVAGILSNTIGVLDQIASRGPDRNLAGVFTVASILLSAVGCFTGGAATVAVAGVSIALSVVGPATTDGSRSNDVDHYSNTLAFMKQLLENNDFGLGGRVFDEETNIRYVIRKTIDEIGKNRMVFDPRPGPIDSTVDINRPAQSVTDTVYSLMADIAGALDWVGDSVRASAREAGGTGSTASLTTRLTSLVPWSRRFGPSGCLVSRHPDVGIGRAGPTEDFQELADLVANLVMELSWEVREGEKNLRAAMDLLDQAESDAAAKLSEAATEFAAGYHGDGQ